MKTRWLALCLVCLALVGSALLEGCKDKGRDGEPGGQPLVFLLSSAHAGTAGASDIEALKTAFRNQAGLAVDIRVAKSPTEGLTAVGAGEADIGLLPLFQFLLAHKGYGANALFQLVRNEGADSYASEILVRSDSDIITLEMLAGKRMAYVDEYSVGGFILPAAFLAERRIRILSEFTGSHAASLAELRDGKVDVAATYSGASAGDPTFRVLGTTATIPNEPIFVRGSLDEKIRDRVQEGFARLMASSQGQEVLAKLGDIRGLKPVSDEAYLEAIPVFARAGKFLQEQLPGGRGFSWASPPFWPLY